jgi:hypothetical protein
MRLLLTLCLVLAAAATAPAQNPFPVEPFPLPFRSAALTEDLYALRYNPAGMGKSQDVELGWFHHYAAKGPGGNNAVFLRAKNAAGSISWIEDPVRGNRREYFLGAGSPLSTSFFVGTTYRYIKANDSSLQNKHTWTHSILFEPSRMWSVGARWENPWHTEVGGIKSDGTITAALAAHPAGDRLDLAVDWIYPEKAKFDDTRLVWSAALHATAGLDIAGFYDTDNRFGVELRIMVERSAVGNEARYRSPGGWRDGTFYISLLQRDYDHAKIPRRGPQQLPDFP